MAAESRSKEIEEASDKAFLVPAPPEIEWWDEGLLSQPSYENWDDPSRNKISSEDSIITVLIQHPVMLAPPQDKFIPEPKPLMLTVKEQKKLRRQRRMAEMKEEQAKIRLGLVEPPPPKVKKSNMMRVLGEQAVKDPTAVEARVNREIAQRAQDHEQANADRALTHEERLAKLARQQAGDEAKGVKIVVFRVDDLSSGKHRYQVDVNAKQSLLTGIVILNPTMNLVVVEGGAHSINQYKKLMLNRVKWTENTPPIDGGSGGGGGTFTSTTDGSNANATLGTRGSGSKAAEWCQPLDERGELKDLSGNRCVLVWEGEAGQRAFKRWGSRACETDGEARDVLGRSKMENMLKIDSFK
jgi:U4/U6 small nuclear ribonucleoprotein PRP3